MTAEPEMLPYGMHVQRLLAYLEECGLGTSEVASGGANVRDEAERFVAAFVRFDGPDEPERFRAVASRLVDFMQRFANESLARGESDDMERYQLLKRSLSDLLVEELGPPQGYFFE